MIELFEKTQTPLPDDVVIIVPPKVLGSVLSNLSGCWRGVWDGSEKARLNSTLIIESLSANTVRLLYSWGDNEHLQISKGYERQQSSIMLDDNQNVSFGWEGNDHFGYHGHYKYFFTFSVKEMKIKGHYHASDEDVYITLQKVALE